MIVKGSGILRRSSACAPYSDILWRKKHCFFQIQPGQCCQPYRPWAKSSQWSFSIQPTRHQKSRSMACCTIWGSLSLLGMAIGSKLGSPPAPLDLFPRPATAGPVTATSHPRLDSARKKTCTWIWPRAAGEFDPPMLDNEIWEIRSALLLEHLRHPPKPLETAKLQNTSQLEIMFTTA